MVSYFSSFGPFSLLGLIGRRFETAARLEARITTAVAHTGVEDISVSNEIDTPRNLGPGRNSEE